MRAFWRAVALAGVGAVVLAGCGVEASKEAVKDFKQKGGAITVDVDQEFTITLKSNATTGYSWELADSLDDDIVRFRGSDYLEPQKDRLGVGGDEELRFTAQNPGTATIELQYLQPWDKETAPAKTETYKLTVR